MLRREWYETEPGYFGHGFRWLNPPVRASLCDRRRDGVMTNFAFYRNSRAAELCQASGLIKNACAATTVRFDQKRQARRQCGGHRFGQRFCR